MSLASMEPIRISLKRTSESFLPSTSLNLLTLNLPLTLYLPSVVAMDWRAMSRSRSRISMDWRPTSRSRSRVADIPMNFDQPALPHSQSLENQFPFPMSTSGFFDGLREGNAHSRGLVRSAASISVPGPSSLSSGRQSPILGGLASGSNPLPSVIEDPADHLLGAFDLPTDSRYSHSIHLNNLSSFDDSFVPSSLPAFGLYDFPKTSGLDMGNAPSQETRSFPRHVRKTSFDHTVNREMMMQNIGGRHQVNGKPLPPPESSLGTKRPADNVHFDSLLRTDPSNLDSNMMRLISLAGVADRPANISPFASSQFNFAYSAYEGTCNSSCFPDISHLLTQIFLFRWKMSSIVQGLRRAVVLLLLEGWVRPI